MCEYCEVSTHVELLDTDYDNCGEGIVISMDAGKRELSAVGFYNGYYCCGAGTIEINYCPMCGRDLRGEN